MARSTTERLAEKTAERQFLHEVETDFELAPAASRAVLATAQQVLLASGGEPRQGQMRLTAVSAEEQSGKPLAAMKGQRRGDRGRRARGSGGVGAVRGGGTAAGADMERP